MNLNFKLEGIEGKPVLVLAHSLGGNIQLWDPLMPLLLSDFQVIRFDFPGHGQSSSGGKAILSLEDLAQALLGILDQLGIAKGHYLGISLGGLLGLHLGIHHSNRFYSLTLCNTGAKIGEAQAWEDRRQRVLKEGMQGLSLEVLPRWFSQDFMLDHSAYVQAVQAGVAQCDPMGYAGCCAALRDADLRPHLSSIFLPTLIVAGALDPVTGLDLSEEMLEGIPEAALCILDKGMHLAPLEFPESFFSAYLNFLKK